MREIKFRAWVEIDEIYSLEYFALKSITLDGKMVQGHNYFFDMPEEKFIMQYTGLKDNNGKNVYEGDIVRFKDFHEGWSPKKDCSVWDATCVIEWQQESASFKLTEIDGNRYLFYPNCWFCYYFEVIGNIHENPELLK